MLSQLLDKYNVKYEDLTIEEKETLNLWLTSLETNILTLDKVKDYVKSLTESVEKELSNYDLPKEKDLFLKARLKNYLTIQDFLTAPDKARKRLEESLINLKK